MTRTTARFSDMELTAFLDGEADASLAQSIEGALETDAALATRMAALDAPVHALRAAFDLDALGAPSMPAHLTKPATNKTTIAKYIALPTALAASFALGLFMAPQPQPPAPGWIDQVASYQALYGPQTLAGAPQDPARTQIALMQAQAALEFDFNAAPAIEGLTFKRAQLLAIKGKPLIQLAYVDAAGAPFALCITRVGNADRGTKTKMAHDIAAASWVKGGLGYVLVGGQDGAFVGNLADDLQRTL